MKRLKVSTVSFLVLVLLIEISLISRALFFPKIKAQVPQALITDSAKTDKSSISMATLYPLLVWKNIPSTDQNSIQNSSKDSMIYSNNEPLSVPISGKEYVATKKNLSTQDESTLYNNFKNFYDQQLTTTGWEQQIKYSNQQLTTIVADGITGNMWGYLKISNGTLGIFVLSRNITFLVGTSIEPPSCPCNVEYRVFISNPIPSSELEKATK